MGRQRFKHAVGIEPLAHEIAIQPLKFPVVLDAVSSPQPLGQRRLNQRSAVNGLEEVVDGLSRGR